MVYFILNVECFLLQRNSISPGEREKYRTRSPAEPDHKKLKKEEKDMGHVSYLVSIKQRVLNASPIKILICT